ncbi:hypothetical protein TrCOL_g2035 [Triparma columacea]|uniref:Uncharacterized protein n=1 Tax=Triparma columacea TaxID=722753 RepID=A0A9W7GQC8_9STRA|nr:hypothetical protein TrCOL_g2035 [Triparma columacea]
MIEFVLTCFGPFAGITSNPTQTIIYGTPCPPHPPPSCGPITELLKSRPLSHPHVQIHTYLLPVSISGVTSAMSDIFNRHCPYPCLGTTRTVVFLHLGVDGSQAPPSQGAFKLERRGYNNATFRVPDNDGAQPTNQPIDQDQGLDCYLGSLCSYSNDSESSEEGSTTPRTSASPLVDSLVSNLKTKYGDLVEASDDAGRFVCNYTLYTTGRRIREYKSKVEEGGGGGGGDGEGKGVEAMTVFLHVPKFELLGGEIQVEFVRDVMEGICGLMEGGEEGALN